MNKKEEVMVCKNCGRTYEDEDQGCEACHSVVAQQRLRREGKNIRGYE